MTNRINTVLCAYLPNGVEVGTWPIGTAKATITRDLLTIPGITNQGVIRVRRATVVDGVLL